MKVIPFPDRWSEAEKMLIDLLMRTGTEQKLAENAVEYSVEKTRQFFQMPFKYDFKLERHFTPSEPAEFEKQIQNLIDSVKEQTARVIFDRVLLQLIVLHGTIYLQSLDHQKD